MQPEIVTRSARRKPLVFVPDDGDVHDDINTVNAARKAGPQTAASEEGPPSSSKAGGPVITPDGSIEYTVCLPSMGLLSSHIRAIRAVELTAWRLVSRA